MTTAAPLTAQMRIRRPDEKLERRPRRVLKAVIQIVVGNGRADPERDLSAAVGEQIKPIMMMVLHYTQRRMEHQPVQQVGELAQPAADALRRLPPFDHEPFAVALPHRGRSHEPPERKDFARPDEHARHFRRGKPQIDGLVFLEPHVHVAEPPPDERGMAICQYRKRLFPPRPGKGAGAAQILQMPEHNALPARKLVCKRAQITKQLTRHRPPPP